MNGSLRTPLDPVVVKIDKADSALRDAEKYIIRNTSDIKCYQADSKIQGFPMHLYDREGLIVLEES